MHLGADDLEQPLVARQSEQIIDMISLAPAHQLFAAEAAVGPELACQSACCVLTHIGLPEKDAHVWRAED
jgi:hypothetical protein